ncbi:MAG TPA: twin-arginine translocase TatA/TatE family subunit [Candidatus Dormibacteraeota bacterium]|jgi:TatA/E family protein of Tat protein translocase|nr:twin-arginine translocase TatA/TatE family subunit [Candidatus Dormibacteraeota bacterium]
MPFSAGHWPFLLILLVIVLIIWGPGKLPELGSGMGKAIREFRKASTEVKDQIVNATAETPSTTPVQTTAPVPPAAAAAPPAPVAPTPEQAAHATVPPPAAPAAAPAPPVQPVGQPTEHPSA